MDKTLIKGIEVLELVVSARDGIRSADVARELGLSRSNAHRVLQTLEATGYLTQDPNTRLFRATLRMWEKGAQIVERLDLRRCAASYLIDLAQDSGEAVHLSVLDRNEVIYLEKIDSPQPVGAYTRTGGRAPAYCVATGKALLSELDEDRLQPILAGLHPHSAQTITDPRLLLEELHRTRQRGWSLNRGEWRISVWGIGAVVRDSSKNPIAAIGVSGPAFRLSEQDRIEALSVLVCRAARAISRDLGCRP